MFNLFKRKAPPIEVNATSQAAQVASRDWLGRLRSSLLRTGSSIATVFTGKLLDDEAYNELESALLMADAGVPATQYILEQLKLKIKQTGSTDMVQIKGLLVEVLTELLKPLERELDLALHRPTVVMVTGVNGAGKTTSVGKLTRHLSDAGASVLLAAADTFRAAAKEQLMVWADRNHVDIISQDNGDPAAVSFDAVSAGKARAKDVVLVDTAGRLPTQLHLMDELKKIQRVIQKAEPTAPHEILLVIDGNTGQNALAQVKAFDEALGLSGLIITKLDGTAKGGVLAAIALWARERKHAQAKTLAVYFVGIGEKLEDLQSFKADEFAQALIN